MRSGNPNFRSDLAPQLAVPRAWVTPASEANASSLARLHGQGPAGISSSVSPTPSYPSPGQGSPCLLLPPFYLSYASFSVQTSITHAGVRALGKGTATTQGPHGDTPPPLTCRFSHCPGCSGCSSSTGRRWGHRSPDHRTRGGMDLGRERPAQRGERLSIPQTPLPGCSEHTLPGPTDAGKGLGTLCLSYPISIIL